MAVRQPGWSFRCLELLLWSAASTFWCEMLGWCGAPLGGRHGETGLDGEGQESTEDSEARVDPALSGANPSNSVVCVETELHVA